MELSPALQSSLGLRGALQGSPELSWALLRSSPWLSGTVRTSTELFRLSQELSGTLRRSLELSLALRSPPGLSHRCARARRRLKRVAAGRRSARHPVRGSSE
eukprot:6449100-Alexandrium_andersonii.AAC.1